MTHLYQLVLVSEIHDWEEKGWKRCNDRVHVAIGGWPSVWMKKEVEG